MFMEVIMDGVVNGSILKVFGANSIVTRSGRKRMEIKTLTDKDFFHKFRIIIIFSCYLELSHSDYCKRKCQVLVTSE